MIATIAGPLLVVYLVLLLATTYHAQQDLRVASRLENRLALEAEATRLGHFFRERFAEVVNLAQDRALEVYFANRALGMSMEYGLGASLRGMESRMLSRARCWVILCALPRCSSTWATTRPSSPSRAAR